MPPYATATQQASQGDASASAQMPTTPTAMSQGEVSTLPPTTDPAVMPPTPTANPSAETVLSPPTPQQPEAANSDNEVDGVLDKEATRAAMKNWTTSVSLEELELANEVIVDAINNKKAEAAALAPEPQQPQPTLDPQAQTQIQPMQPIQPLQPLQPQ